MFAWVTKTFYYQKCLTSVQSLPNRSCLTDRNCLRNKSLLSISKVRPHLGLGCTRTKLKQHKITYHLVSSMLPAGQSFRASIYLKSAHQSGRFKLNIAKSKLLGNSFPFSTKYWSLMLLTIPIPPVLQGSSRTIIKVFNPQI